MVVSSARELLKRPAASVRKRAAVQKQCMAKRPPASTTARKRPAGAHASRHGKGILRSQLPQQDFLLSDYSSQEEEEDYPASVAARVLTVNVLAGPGSIQVDCTSLDGASVTKGSLPHGTNLFGLEDFVLRANVYNKSSSIRLTFFSDSGTEVSKTGQLKDYTRLAVKACREEGIHFHKGDEWGCAAGGGDDAVRLKVDLDLGAFPVPALLNLTETQQCKVLPKRRIVLGHVGKLLQMQSAEVRAESLTSAFEIIGRVICQNRELDPHNKYQDTLDLYNTLANLRDIMEDFSAQGPKAIAAIKHWLASSCQGHTRVVVQERHFQQRYGHIWGNEHPAEELEDLERQLNHGRLNHRKAGEVQSQITKLHETWSEYNTSSYHERKETVLYFLKDKASLASVRLRISVKVHRECCCVNPFNGEIEL